MTDRAPLDLRDVEARLEQWPTSGARNDDLRRVLAALREARTRAYKLLEWDFHDIERMGIGYDGIAEDADALAAVLDSVKDEP